MKGTTKIFISENSVEDGFKFVEVYDECMNLTRYPCSIEKVDAFLNDLLTEAGGEWSKSSGYNAYEECYGNTFKKTSDVSTKLSINEVLV